jgi:predicted SprT family Zn-dependent metalloprotease
MYYWVKLALPLAELPLLAITQDRREYMAWTGKRLDTLALGCYCYLTFVPARPTHSAHSAIALRPNTSGRAAEAREHRHLIFIEPEMQPRSIEVTVAHELIHLADRVHGTPRRHRHHGYDSIANDEAAVTGYAPEELRALLREESGRREQVRRARRPLRYLYRCPRCDKHYPRARRYSHAVSCSSCDTHFNPLYQLVLVAG